MALRVELLGGLDALFDGASALSLSLADIRPTAAAASASAAAAAAAGAAAEDGPAAADDARSPAAAAAAATAAAAAAAEVVVTMRDLLVFLRAHYVRDRPELFFASGVVGGGGSGGGAADVGVRPGVLVLVNDCDWELEGTLACSLRDGDVVAFISTLHGG